MERRIGGVSHGVSGSVCVFSKGDKKAPEKFNGVWRTAEISCCWKNYSIDKKGNREKGGRLCSAPWFGAATRRRKRPDRGAEFRPPSTLCVAFTRIAA